MGASLLGRADHLLFGCSIIPLTNTKTKNKLHHYFISSFIAIINIEHQPLATDIDLIDNGHNFQR